MYRLAATPLPQIANGAEAVPRIIVPQTASSEDAKIIIAQGEPRHVRLGTANPYVVAGQLYRVISRIGKEHVIASISEPVHSPEKAETPRLSRLTIYTFAFGIIFLATSVLLGISFSIFDQAWLRNASIGFLFFFSISMVYSMNRVKKLIENERPRH